MATGATLVLTISLDEVYEPLIHLEPVERSEHTHLRDHSKPDPARQPEKYRDKFKGLRVFVIKHPQYKEDSAMYWIPIHPIALRMSL